MSFGTEALFTRHHFFNFHLLTSTVRTPKTRVHWEPVCSLLRAEHTWLLISVCVHCISKKQHVSRTSMIDIYWNHMTSIPYVYRRLLYGESIWYVLFGEFVAGGGWSLGVVELKSCTFFGSSATDLILGHQLSKIQQQFSVIIADLNPWPFRGVVPPGEASGFFTPTLCSVGVMFVLRWFWKEAYNPTRKNCW